MRKGEEKRLQLLDAAEKLFCQQGYDKTSVQDIIGVTGVSKGGFYHHFTGKDQMLAELCARRAERSAAYTAEALRMASNPMERINAVLHGFTPLRREETEFMTVMLPVITKAEGRGMAVIYQEALEKDFLPLLKAEIAAATNAQIVFPVAKEMESVILSTVNHAWMSIATAMAAARERGVRLEPTAYLAQLEKYRRAIEVLLDAPYGSIEILRVEELEEISRIIA